MRLKQIMKSVLYVPKHTKPTDENIIRLLLPSLVGIGICMVCLAGMTWAWFTASVTTPTQTITAAKYDVAVSVDGTAVSTENGQYTLNKGEHIVTLTAAGNASTGYCKIIFNNKDTPYYTPQFPNPKEQNPATEFTFKIEVSEVTKMTVIPTWGTYTGTDILSSDSLLDLTAPPPNGRSKSNNSAPAPDETTVPGKDDEQTYTVVSGDSLWEIAKRYETTSDKLAAYNSIEVSSTLQIGQKIKIPPADYEIPANPVTSGPEPERSAPDTTSSQTADTDTTSSSVSEQGGSDSTQLEGESHDNSAGE